AVAVAAAARRPARAAARMRRRGEKRKAFASCKNFGKPARRGRNSDPRHSSFDGGTGARDGDDVGARGDRGERDAAFFRPSETWQGDGDDEHARESGQALFLADTAERHRWRTNG